MSEQLADRHPTLVKAGEKLCTCCRKRLPNTSVSNEVADEEEPVSTTSDMEGWEECPSPEMALEVVNDTLTILGQSHLKKRRLSTSKSYAAAKLSQIQTAAREQLSAAGFSRSDEEGSRDGGESEIIACLKNKFNKSQLRSEKVTILTIFGTSWTIRRMMSEFGCSQRMACQAVQLAKESGIHTSPNPKRGRPLHEDTRALVIAFYKDEELSRLMPGKKDFLLVREDGKRLHAQKRLLLCNLKEAYQLFVSRYPDMKIGFSKFAELRPKECVIAGSSGTHSVCVCTTHQNVKLMMVGTHMEDASDGVMQLNHYSSALAVVRCNLFHPRCALGECTCCPGPDRLREHLLEFFEDKEIDEVE